MVRTNLITLAFYNAVTFEARLVADTVDITDVDGDIVDVDTFNDRLITILDKYFYNDNFFDNWIYSKKCKLILACGDDALMLNADDVCRYGINDKEYNKLVR